MTCQVQRSINPDCFANHRFLKDKIESISQRARTCSACGREVFLHVTWNKNPVMPIDKVAIIGCDGVIDEVINGILLESARQGWMLSDCFESKKS